MSQQVPAWQENKSLHERNRYMLENEIATDVCFEFGSSDSSVAYVHAHTFMLVSPVFEAMFGGGMAESRPDRDDIKIEDIDAKTFKEMLRYIYCDKADITATTAGPLLFAAKKYLLTRLVSVCLEVLETSISADTVCRILQEMVLFGKDKLKRKCFNFISYTASPVFNSEGFKHVSRDVLKIIVSLKTLTTTEKHIFESCVRWAKHQLLEIGNKDPSDGEIREKLGDVLYEIRFPTMTTEEFAALTAHSKILTGDEKHDVYVYTVTKERLESLKFMTHRRFVKEVVIKRLTVSDVTHWNYTNGRCDAIAFETKVAMVLTGVGLYGGIQRSTHDVTLRLLKGDLTVSETNAKMTSNGNNTPARVGLEQPVVIPANSRHILVAVISGSTTWSGLMSVSDFERSAKIVFYSTEHCTNGTDVNRGQIPELYVVLTTTAT